MRRMQLRRMCMGTAIFMVMAFVIWIIHDAHDAQTNTRDMPAAFSLTSAATTSSLPVPTAQSSTRRCSKCIQTNRICTLEHNNISVLEVYHNVNDCERADALYSNQPMERIMLDDVALSKQDLQY